MADNLLEVRNLKKYFPVKSEIFKRTVAQVKAVDDISFSVEEGETLGLVGESGCGKSTTGRTILRLLKATAGDVVFEGKRVMELDAKEMRLLRRDMQIIFQDPYASLNPRMTVADIVGEPLVIHKLVTSKEEKYSKVKEILENVGMGAEYMNRYPHEFSGGQRQRIGVARALAVDPKLIIADEPVSALDVSVQAQVINLLQDLQKEYGLTYLFIAHDLSVVKHISDRVAVMYLGKIVELTDKKELFKNPMHPYTQSLLSAIPEADPKKKKDRIILKGDVPSPVNPPSGCRFHPRCPEAFEPCPEVEPEFKEYGDGHLAACHLLNN
ncbi:ABC transporter ATP-binding protein [Halanaerobium kushneri]|uniref:Peptide/nickel transport system ATP-binding protein/oligopeptide transport system ATP-binding protein n=1 Tax=Halanaerobium kushneri TaxID=56779 RepID=A0A1N6S3J2_9FIRM|nr:dipeptide ABC transporter ATP-binding protein [Halanaerobium kushneri]SIQ35587.1 peptide/nickel transport system ATP-binding protein/oligopeptide transport system ATP-binding protein [Halanaerobium kushneri]